MNNIVTFIRHPRKNNRIGVVIATQMTTDPKKVGIGWSLTAVNHGDQFDKSKGLMIALNRANEGSNKPTPNSILDEVSHMRARAVKYFKDCEVID